MYLQVPLEACEKGAAMNAIHITSSISMHRQTGWITCNEAHAPRLRVCRLVKPERCGSSRSCKQASRHKVCKRDRAPSEPGSCWS